MEYPKLVIVAILASLLTISVPYTIMVFKRFLTWIKSKATTSSPTYSNVNNDLEKRIEALEQEMRVRETNRTAKVKKIVIDYLTELKDGK